MPGDSRALDVACGEAGFDGGDLLAAGQRNFVFASVAVDDVEAAALIAKACEQHQVGAAELQTPWLVASSSGVELIATLVEACRGRFGLTFHDKLFAFCDDLYDFTFRPLFGGHIGRDMSASVAMWTYGWLQDHADEAAQAVVQFLDYRRSLDPSDAPFWFATRRPPLSGQFTEHSFEAILRLVYAYRDVIVDDNARFWTLPRSFPWAVGHTANCYWAHMNHWGRTGRSLYVRCARSEALRVIVGKIAGEGEVDPGIIVAPGHEGRRADWLATPRAEFVDAKRHSSLQLADILARAGEALLANRLAGEGDALPTSLVKHGVGRPIYYDDGRVPQKRAALNGSYLLWLSALAELDGAGPDQDFRALYNQIETTWQEADPSAGA
jgi:hypothetical protein